MDGERSGQRFQEKSSGGDEWMSLRMGKRCGCVIEMEGREVGTATAEKKNDGGR